MQLSLIDPRQNPVATKEIMADFKLRVAIAEMRRRNGSRDQKWPYVERLIDVAGRPAWAVDDAGTRYVVVRDMVFGIKDLPFAAAQLRTTAITAFRRLDAGGVADGRRP